jgi:hypothetical protein
MKFSELWIRIHGPDTDPDLILIQDFDDQKLKKKIAIYFFLCLWIIMPSWIRIRILFNMYSIISHFSFHGSQMYPDSDRNPECRLRESLPDLVGSVQGLSHRVVGLKNERGIPINIVPKALDTPVVNIFI